MNDSRRKQEGKYMYKKLESGNLIRVLHLDSARLKGEALVGRLETVDLNRKSSKISRSNTADESVNQEQSYRKCPDYEALSWCWGNQEATEPLDLRNEKDIRKSIYITPNLAQALRCLRRSSVGSGQPRALWVDAICINLEDSDERAHQVAQMNLVYGRASNVCVWLDDDPPAGKRYGLSTQDVFKFVKTSLLDLANFDQTVKNRANAAYWLALVQLMTKQWFSRRWVIQEIALARKATVHCGDARMKWETFAHAVSLFVKAESVDHRLSEIVGNDDTWNHKKGLFWDIDRMGAVSLVEMTTANFYNPARGVKRPVSTLESLMSMLPMFESSKACDTIYALLAIARDTTPEADGLQNRPIDKKTAYQFVKRFSTREEGFKKLEKARKVVTMLAAGFRSKPYIVSYSKKPVDVYKDFVGFCIYQSRSLDIICRPWAPKPDRDKEGNRPSNPEEEEPPDEQYLSDSESSQSSSSSSDSDEPPAEWADEFDHRIDDPPLSLDASSSYPEQNKSDSKRPLAQMSGDSDHTGDFEPAIVQARRSTDRPAKRHKSNQVTTQSLKKADQPQEMPSWIADRSHIAFTLLSADDSMTKMERMNADPLVGTPDLKPYNASDGQQVRMGTLRFLRRGEYDQSLFVEGFVLDHVEVCEQPSLSNIPPSWFTFVDYGHDTTKKSPPIALYRTLIADRGPKGTRPPPYYWLAYNEVLRNRITNFKIEDGMREGKSIITEFLQRVQQATYNRCLMKTATPMKAGKDGSSKPRLGLAPKDTLSRKAAGGGDLICILYGLSVPVILRRFEKSIEEKKTDRKAREEQLPEAYRKAVRTIERHWSFMRALQTALYLMKYDWPPYSDKMPKWREDIKGKFSKLWLDKINADFAARKRLVQAAKPRQPGQRSRASKRDHSKQTPQEKDKIWKEMCHKWNDMLKSKDGYRLKSKNVKDKPIALPSEEHDHYYKVIGECYVDQMMDGEALEYKRAHPEIQDTVFELR